MIARIGGSAPRGARLNLAQADYKGAPQFSVLLESNARLFILDC